MSTHGGPSGGAGGGGLLARVQYAPAVEVAYTFAGAVPVAMDAVHLTISFKAPTSGDVLVRLTAPVQLSSGEGYFCLTDHTTLDQVGNTAFVVALALGGAVINHSAPILVTGLTATDTYQWDFAFLSNGGMIVYVQGAQGIPSWTYAGPATMEILAA